VRGRLGWTCRRSTEIICPFCRLTSRFLLVIPLSVIVCCKHVTDCGNTNVFCIDIGLIELYDDLCWIRSLEVIAAWCLLLARTLDDANGLSSVLSITPSYNAMHVSSLLLAYK